MATSVGKLNVTLSANTAAFSRGMKNARNNTKSLTSGLRAMSSRGKLAFAALGAAAVAGLTKLVRSSFQTVDALAKTADKIGETTEKLAGLQFAGEITGVAIGTTNKALQQMTVSISDATQGIGQAKEEFKVLGLEASELAKKSPVEAFKEIAEAMKGVENRTEKLRIAYKLFGARGAGLVNTLDLGREGLNKLAREALDAGIAVSRIDAAKIEAANDAWTRTKARLEGVGNTLAVNLTPALGTFSNALEFAANRARLMVEDIALNMIELGDVFTGGATSLKIYEDGMRELNKPAKDFTEQIKKAKEEAKALADVTAEAAKQKNLAGLLGRFNTAFENRGKSANDILFDQLENLGASNDVLDEVDRKMTAIEMATKNAAIEEERKLKASEALTKELSSQERILQSIQTPAEKFAEKFQEIASLASSGKLSLSQQDTAIDALKKQFAGGEKFFDRPAFGAVTKGSSGTTSVVNRNRDNFRKLKEGTDKLLLSNQRMEKIMERVARGIEQDAHPVVNLN